MITRVVPADSPFPGPAKMNPSEPWVAVPQWPALWVHPPGCPAMPWVGTFRRRLTLAEATTVRFALTADERCELWIDGDLGDRGPDRGDRSAWHYATYEARLAPGDHVLAVRVWALGAQAPSAQISVRPGLLVGGFGAAHELLSTGVAEWEWRAEPGYDFVGKSQIGPGEHVDFRRDPADAGREEGGGWQPVETGEPGNNGFVLYPSRPVPLLQPSLLPAQRRDRHVIDAPVHADDLDLDAPFAPAGVPAGEWPVTIPAHARRRFLVDLGRYRCGRVQIRAVGGREARVTTRWSEAVLFGDATPEEAGHRFIVYAMKGRRDAWQAGRMRGITDVFMLDGASRELTTLWWRAGRFVLLMVETDAAPLTLEGFAIEETGYPFHPELPPTGDPRWDALAALCLNALRVCAHETTMDCPYYEQLAYAGDARVQFLCWMALCPDDTALMRHTLRHFHGSALRPGGWVSSSAPSGGGQIIPTFPLWWIAMGADFVAHTGDAAFVRPMMPTMRAMVERWLDRVDPALGLARSPAGWNFADTGFPGGLPPGGMPDEVSAVLNAILAHGLVAIEALEQAIGEPELAARYAARRRGLMAALQRHAWDADRGLYRDAPGSHAVSEQMQVLMLLLDETPADCSAALGRWLQEEGAARDGATRCQVFFTYYLFAACRRHGLSDVIERRLGAWWDLLDQGFTTTPEVFGATRSDAHAWGAHPILLALERARR